eukprot:4939401-Alexandrium_andersonii.AAC.1
MPQELMGKWKDHPRFSSEFDVLMQDLEKEFGPLKRKAEGTVGGSPAKCIKVDPLPVATDNLPLIPLADLPGNM